MRILCFYGNEKKKISRMYWRKLAQQGYTRSAKKCKEKFENVHKYYKRTKEGRAGRQDGKSYRFFSQLEALHTTAAAAAAAAQSPLTAVATTATAPPTPVSIGIGMVGAASGRTQTQATDPAMPAATTTTSAPLPTQIGVSMTVPMDLSGGVQIGVPESSNTPTLPTTGGISFSSNTSSAESEDSEDDLLEAAGGGGSRKRKRESSAKKMRRIGGKWGKNPTIVSSSSSLAKKFQSNTGGSPYLHNNLIRKLVRDLYISSKPHLSQLLHPKQPLESRFALFTRRRLSSHDKDVREAPSNAKDEQTINDVKGKARELKGPKEELKARTKLRTENLYRRVDGAWREAEAAFTKGRLFTGAAIGLVIVGGAYVSTVDEATFCGWLFSATKLVNPFFALLDPETAHQLAIKAAARGWVPREKRPDPSILGIEVWGRKFSNPIGLAAGFDKHAEAVEGLLGMGFGFVEVGSVTPVPQEGNQKPCIFRLRQEGAIINRCGFNSEGIVSVAKRLGAQHGKRKLAETKSTSPTPDDELKLHGKAGPGILGVNLGKNKTSQDAAADYVQGVHTLSQYADYMVFLTFCAI